MGASCVPGSMEGFRARTAVKTTDRSGNGRERQFYIQNIYFLQICTADWMEDQPQEGYPGVFEMGLRVYRRTGYFLRSNKVYS